MIGTMSSSGTPLAFRLRTEEKAKPKIASTWPCASIGSRTGKPTDSMVIALSSIAAASLKAAHWPKAASGGGAPSFLPSSDFGSDVMPWLLRPITAKGGWS